MYFYVYAKNNDDLLRMCLPALQQSQSDVVMLGEKGPEMHPYAFFADSEAALRETLNNLPSPSTAPSKPLALLMTGQGAQFPNMGQWAYKTLPFFRAQIETCCHHYENSFDASLLDILYSRHDDADHPIHQTRWTQPALFAIEYAFAKTWQHLGVQVDYCMGHSVGEYAAATLANVMSLEEGIRLIGLRGQGMQSLPSQGTMAALMTDEATLTPILAQQNNGVLDVAAYNGPKQTVVSGDVDAVQALMTAAKTTHGIRSRALTVSHAFHSEHMVPMLDHFRETARALSFQKPSEDMRIISNVTGTWMTDAPTAEYWCQHIRQPVRFLDGLQCLLETGVTDFLEVGPQPILCGMAAKSTDQPLTLMASCKTKRAEDVFLSTLGQLFVQGRLNVVALKALCENWETSSFMTTDA